MTNCYYSVFAITIIEKLTLLGSLSMNFLFIGILCCNYSGNSPMIHCTFLEAIKFKSFYFLNKCNKMSIILWLNP